MKEMVIVRMTVMMLALTMTMEGGGGGNAIYGLYRYVPL